MEQATGLLERVERVIRRVPIGAEPVAGGYSGAGRWRVFFADDTTAFVKVGTTPWTERAVRQEAAVYEDCDWPFAPRMYGADLGLDLGEPPLIVLEDLGVGHWPPPWSAERIARVRSTLDEVAQTPPPSSLGRLADLRELLMRGWSEVAADPVAFLALGLCSPEWLQAALPILVEAEESVDLDGETLTHFDVRSDNVCCLSSRTVLVDWANACVAHPLTDLLLWLPSLHAEGGPAPEAILPDAPIGAVAVLAGFWAANAGRAAPVDAPGVREVQLRQLRTALPWAARTLGLPEPQGVADIPQDPTIPTGREAFPCT